MIVVTARESCYIVLRIFFTFERQDDQGGGTMMRRMIVLYSRPVRGGNLL